MSLTAALPWIIGFAAGLLLAFAGEPFMKRHPLAGCWFFAFAAVFFAATTAANVVLHDWGWAALQAVLAFGSAATWLRYRDRRKRAKEAP